MFTVHDLIIRSRLALDAPRRAMLRSRPFTTEPPRRRSMGTPGQLKAKVDRLEKKLAAKGATLAADKRRLLHKKLKRFQRAWRTSLALEKRLADKGKAGKTAAKAADTTGGEKPAAPPTEAATPAGPGGTSQGE